MYDPLGKLLTDIRDDTAVGTWTDRIRGGRPGPKDARGEGEYLRFVVITALGTVREKRAPVQYPRFDVACYGTSDQDAMTGYGLVSDAIHAVGPRLATGGGIYQTFDESGGTPDLDPDTRQPVVRFIVEMVATTQAVA